MKRINSLLSAGVTLTSSGTAVAAPIPLDSAGYFPRFVRVVATGAGCFVKVGDIGVTAVSGDCMIQPLDGTVLNVRGCKAISAISVSGTSSVTVVPLEAGSWNYDQRTLDYNFTTLSAVPSTVTFTRGSSGTFFGSDGLMKVQGYNLLTNSVLAGGTAGSPGTLPTGWAITLGLSNGVTRSISAFGTDVNGYPYIEVTFAGTFTALENVGVVPPPGVTSLAASVGEVYTASAYWSVVSGTLPAPVTAGINGVRLRYGSPGLLTQIGSSDTPRTTYGRASTTVTAPASTTVVGTDWLWSFNAGQAVNCTVRIAAFQLEKSSTATQYSPTTTAANSAPRFDYDPATPAGTTGVELAPAFTSWSLGTDWSTSSGTLILTGSGALSAANPPAIGTVGKTYRVTYTVASVSGGGGLNVTSASQATVVRTVTSAGTYTDNIVCDGTPVVLFKRHSGVVNAVISSISVQEVVFTPKGLLIEESRTNLLLHSRDMTQTAWTTLAVDVTPNRNQVGLDGSANTANLITEGSAGTARNRQTPATAVTAGSTITYSTVLKRGNTDWVLLYCGETSLVDYGRAWFNLNTGAKGTANTVGAATNVSSTITSLGGGWYRITLTVTPNGTYTIASVWLQSASADASTTRVSGATYIVDCAQLEVGSFATSYIPTTTASATRSADSASMTGTNLTSWFGGTSGTVVSEFDATYASTSGAILSFDQSTTNTLGLWASSATSIIGEATGATNISVSVAAVSNVNKAAYAFAPSDRAVSVNGGTVSTQANGGIPASVDTFRMGVNRSGSSRLNGHIRRIQYYPTRLPNATLVTLTS